MVVRIIVMVLVKKAFKYLSVEKLDDVADNLDELGELDKLDILEETCKLRLTTSSSLAEQHSRPPFALASYLL